MKRVFVDSNVFLRFFTKDDRSQHTRAVRLFRDAAVGKVQLVTGPPVLFEIAWTLRSAYGLERKKVLDVLESVSAQTGLELCDGPLVERAIRLARAGGGDFADAYVAAVASESGADALATFNRKDFARLGIPLHAL